MPLLGALKNNIIISRLPNQVSDLMMLNIKKQRARYKYFPYKYFPQVFPCSSFRFSWQPESTNYTKLDVARKNNKYIETFFLWELSTCGRSMYIVSMCFGVAAYFCWYFKYYEYALVYLLVYVFPSESKQAKVFESFSVFLSFFSKISYKTAGCQLWSA